MPVPAQGASLWPGGLSGPTVQIARPMLRSNAESRSTTSERNRLWPCIWELVTGVSRGPLATHQQCLFRLRPGCLPEVRKHLSMCILYHNDYARYCSVALRSPRSCSRHADTRHALCRRVSSLPARIGRMRKVLGWLSCYMPAAYCGHVPRTCCSVCRALCLRCAGRGFPLEVRLLGHGAQRGGVKTNRQAGRVCARPRLSSSREHTASSCSTQRHGGWCSYLQQLTCLLGTTRCLCKSAYLTTVPTVPVLANTNAGQGEVANRGKAAHNR